MAQARFVRWFAELTLADVPEVGGKNASLGELVRDLRPRGIGVPDGFALTAAAYHHVLDEAGLRPALTAALAGLDIEDLGALQKAGRAARAAIGAAALPPDVLDELAAAYDRLCADAGHPDIDVAVRSSATAEDLPEASFAGQQETYLGVVGHAALAEAVRKCMASLFTDRAISYRQKRGFDHFAVGLSVGVQRMVRADLAASGVMFTLDTESGFRDVVLVNGAYGLGENVVQGTVNPDEAYVFKPTLAQGKRPILQKTVGSKEVKLVYDEGGGRHPINVPVPAEDRQRFCITDDELLTLARWACDIETHYSERRGAPTPMDIEWAKDGRTGALFIVQARPETVQSQQAADVLTTWRLSQKGQVLVTGRAVGHKIGQGPVQVIRAATDIEQFRPGSVLVTEMTDPDWEPVMRTAAAIVTERGGRTCHAAIVSRELGLPAVVGATGAIAALHPGDEVTVSCAEGDEGRVYAGRLGVETEQVSLRDTARPRTKVMMNLANPRLAFEHAQRPCDGVGLMRLEFIITDHIGVHPMALVRGDEVADPAVRRAIAERTAGYSDPGAFFVDRLAQGVATIAAAFYPRPVIVRWSDFKTNEYAHLLGGAQFEPPEHNPMIGFRGASRYYDERYRAGFALECQAVRRVREDMGLTNVKVMVPFCRTVEEGRRVQAEMARHGLVRGENGLEVYVMCEIPSNVVLAEQFAEIFDGFSIGSNDLTQLTLGVDRDSALLAPLFDERDPAVLWMLDRVIGAAHDAGRPVGICGQAPSDHEEIVRFLVARGIDSLSLTPDAVLPTTLTVLEVEGGG